MSDALAKTARRQRLGENRIFLLLAVVFLIMACGAPGFLTSGNQAAVLKGMSLNVLAAIGFTMVMIAGQLDLSIGTNLTLGGLIAIGLQPCLGWPGSIAAAVACGLVVGLINGLLVAKVKVDSFIVTLGTMIISQGLIYRVCGPRGTLTVSDFQFGDWLNAPLLPPETVPWLAPLSIPRVLVASATVALFEALLKGTPVGRGFHLVGGNRQAAWHAGLAVDRYVTGAFILSGVLACLGGALFSISISSAMPTMGNNSLMEIIAAVIIGGAAMSGGRGSVVKSMVALWTLAMLYNGLSLLGAGWEIRKIASGVVLAAVILYEAWLAAQKNKTRGQRRELLEDLDARAAAEDEQERSTPMDRKDPYPLAIVCVATVGCVAIVAIFAMYFTTRNAPPPAAAQPFAAPRQAEAAPEDSGIWALKSKDGQPLLLPAAKKEIPARPADPDALPEEDPLHWYDLEYAGWNAGKVNLPKSPGDGPQGKRVIFLKMVDHPYNTAYSTGMKKVADCYGIQMKTLVANNDINVQAQQVDQAINERPDLVIINPVDARACVPLLRRMNEAGVAVIASNLLPVDDGMQYILSWTGPDDWAQFRLLAREFARLMSNEGGYCVVQHRPGSSPFFSRTFAVVTELKKIAPKMKLLAKQTTDLESEKTKDVVSGWITRFGPEMKGIVSADDSGAMIGINEAIKNAGREDIIRVSAGNSKVGMDFIKEGRLQAVTCQSPEADGALPVKLAADWFSGREIPAVRYLPIRIITKENVDRYLPAQW